MGFKLPPIDPKNMQKIIELVTPKPPDGALTTAEVEKSIETISKTLNDTSHLSDEEVLILQAQQDGLALAPLAANYAEFAARTQEAERIQDRLTNPDLTLDERRQLSQQVEFLTAILPPKPVTAKAEITETLPKPFNAVDTMATNNINFKKIIAAVKGKPAPVEDGQPNTISAADLQFISTGAKPPPSKASKLLDTTFKTNNDIQKLKDAGDAKGAALFEKALAKLTDIAKGDISDQDFSNLAGGMRGLMNFYTGLKTDPVVPKGDVDKLTAELKKIGLAD